MVLNGKTTIVVGGSRGLRRGIATAFAEAGATVIAVSRTSATFAETANGAGSIQSEVGDAADATMAARLIDRYEPEIVVLVAGASPHMRPLRQQTWETFSVNWETDVRIAFHWLRETLLTPLRPGSRVIVVSSGAALEGSPLTGVGQPAVQAYAARFGQSVEAFLEPLGPFVTPEIAGVAMIELVQADAATTAPAYLLTGAGLERLP